VDGETVAQVLRDYAALRGGDTDPELEAVRAAVLIEDVFGVTLSDAEIDPAVLGDASAVAALLARLRGPA
jgi:hypothetical protein